MESKAPKEKPVKLGFTYEPELIGSGPNGEMTVVDANHYIILQSASVGKIVYTYKDNKYWTGENAECPEELLKSKFLPYLRWKFDVLEDEVVMAERNDKMVPIKTGRKISSFPPSPENIAAKRKEMISAALKSGEEANLKQIWNATAPVRLVENEAFEAMIDKTPEFLKMARKLYRP